MKEEFTEKADRRLHSMCYMYKLPTIYFFHGYNKDRITHGTSSATNTVMGATTLD